MKIWGLLFFLGLLLFSVISSATELSWVKMGGLFSYRDLTTACSETFDFNAVFLALEIEDGRPVKAFFRKYANYSSSKYSLEFSPDELKGIELYKDYYGRYWVKEISLSSRLTGWALMNLGSFICSPSRPIKSVEPDPVRFYFETEGLGLELMLSPSNEVELKGSLEKDMPFEAELKFIQKMVQ